MKSLPQKYDHKEAETRWQGAWEAAGTYHWLGDKPRDETFVVDTPPPTVSGVLHMGHIFSYTQADFVARFQRMSGKDVFYPMGFDDNGLPTERLVEKVKNVRATALAHEPGGREKFVALCREVVQEAEDQFRDLFRSAALSVDWRQEYQTVSDDVTKLSQLSFLDLFTKDQAYRDFRPTYWDWVDQTAIAQAEIENKDMAGAMYDLQFSVDGKPITIATTRPELLGACVAVMYHPEDENAAKYKGKEAVTPVFGVKVPMIADEAVDREFGSGLVMCCTYGDDTDKEWQRKHSLPRRTLLGLDGRILVLFDHAGDDETAAVEYVRFIAGTDGSNGLSELGAGNCADIAKAGTAYQQILNLKPKQARDKVVELLEAEGALLGSKQIQHTVKCAERSGTPIEIIPTYQWFVRICDKKDALLAKGAECNWHPEFMRIRLNQWIEGLKEDWCISRQRFFGVPFPVWYVYEEDASEPKIVAASPEQLPVDPLSTLPVGYLKVEDLEDVPGGRKLGWVAKDPDGKEVTIRPEAGVMDTWATSSISPQINARGIGCEHDPDAKRHAQLFPADVRPQAHEIIRTWAFYTIVKAHLHEDTIPWKNLMISGWCLASDKTKMSKSKGNVVTPVELIQEKGSDAVRYWASTSRLGADTAFSEDVLKIGRKLVTKIWNASNFASMHLNKLAAAPTTAAKDIASGVITEPLDIWLLQRLHETVAKATAEFARYEYCDARVAVEDFFWNDFCDNYLELVKERAYNETGKNIRGQQSALATLHHALSGVLRLFAPFVPHVTEEIYSHIFDDAFDATGSVHARGNWPLAADYPTPAVEKDAGIAVMSILEAIRKSKSERNVSLKAPLGNVLVKPAAEENAKMLESLSAMLADVRGAANASSVTLVDQVPESATLTPDGRFLLEIPVAYTEIRQPENGPKLENPMEKLEYQGHCTTQFKDLSHSAKSTVEPVFQQTQEKSR